MNTRAFWWLVGIVAVLIVISLLVYGAHMPSTTGIATSTPTGTGQAPQFDQNISDGTVGMAYPSADFGLATNPAQILIRSYIPPCGSNFNYCLYYKGDAYAGTNFESAGVRYQKRTDLSTERTCLNTPPDGFDSTFVPTASSSEDTYSSSVFNPVGDAGAGHTASGSLYRLFVRANSSCYEFETRIGKTQFANYPAGSIKEFTATDEANVATELSAVIQNLSLNGTKNLFPH